MQTKLESWIKMLTLRFTDAEECDCLSSTVLLIRAMPEVLRVRVELERYEIEVLYRDSSDNNNLARMILLNALPEDSKITGFTEN